MTYFTLAELCHSDTATKLGIKNIPSQREKDNINALIDHLLSPIREAWGCPIYVNSGYRCATLNKKVGGVANSQHILGEAADLDTRRGKAENKRLFEFIKTHFQFDQLINENDYSWVHVSYRRPNRQQVLNLKTR